MKMTKKTILQTFDYELFLGTKTGSNEKCLLKPTNKLIQCFDEYNIKATFFIDILYYIRMFENKETKEKSKLIKEQLQNLVNKGHRIELHLHPSWLDAEYTNKQWNFKTQKHYRLHSLPPQKIENLFTKGTVVLEDIAKEVISDYKVIAFRAGGWCIQPFDKLRKSFINNGIKIDSTIAKGFICKKSDIMYYDFTNANDKEYYKFSNDPIIEDAYGMFYEIPITTYKLNIINKIQKNILKRKYKLQPKFFEIIGDGKGLSIGSSSNNILKWKSEISNLIFPYYMYHIQRTVVPEYLTKTLKNDKRKVITFISHPKNISPASFEAIKTMSKLNYCYVNMYEFYKERTK